MRFQRKKTEREQISKAGGRLLVQGGGCPAAPRCHGLQDTRQQLGCFALCSAGSGEGARGHTAAV